MAEQSEVVLPNSVVPAGLVWEGRRRVSGVRGRAPFSPVGWDGVEKADPSRQQCKAGVASGPQR